MIFQRKIVEFGGQELVRKLEKARPSNEKRSNLGVQEVVQELEKARPSIEKLSLSGSKSLKSATLQQKSVEWWWMVSVWWRMVAPDRPQQVENS